MTHPRHADWIVERFSDQEIFECLRWAANENKTLTHDEYEARRPKSFPSAIRIVQRFGWNNALEAAGLKPQKIHTSYRRDRIDEDRCISALSWVGYLCGHPQLPYRTYERLAEVLGLPSGTTVRNRLGQGRWDRAKDRAGVK